MSSTPLPPPRTIQQGSRVAIVAARFNPQYVDALIERCVDELEHLDPTCEVQIQRVPGSFEVPLGVQQVIEHNEDIDAVIAFGILLEGETGHALLVAQSVTQALQTIGLSHQIPVINQVLLVADEDQAHARAHGDEINRGTEAARAAISMLDDLRRIQRSREQSGREAAPQPLIQRPKSNPLPKRHHG